jgi:hypothetical protein
LNSGSKYAHVLKQMYIFDAFEKALGFSFKTIGDLK